MLMAKPLTRIMSDLVQVYMKGDDGNLIPVYVAKDAIRGNENVKGQKQVQMSSILHWIDFASKSGMFIATTGYLVILLSWATCKGVQDCQTNNPTHAVTVYAFHRAIPYWLLWNYRLTSTSIVSFMFVQAVQLFTNYTTSFPLFPLMAKEGRRMLEQDDTH